MGSGVWCSIWSGEANGRGTAKRLLPAACAAGYRGSDRNFRRLVAGGKRQVRGGMAVIRGGQRCGRRVSTGDRLGAAATG